MGKTIDRCNGSPLPLALVVDDDPLVRRAIARQLASGFLVYQAGSEASALATLDEVVSRTPPGRVNLAFVDYELPDGTGLPILERLRIWPDGIRVLMSGNLEKLAEFRQCGNLVPLVLTKPLKPASIEAAKRAALAISEENGCRQ